MHKNPTPYLLYERVRGQPYVHPFRLLYTIVSPHPPHENPSSGLSNHSCSPENPPLSVLNAVHAQTLRVLIITVMGPRSSPIKKNDNFFCQSLWSPHIDSASIPHGLKVPFLFCPTMPFRAHSGDTCFLGSVSLIPLRSINHVLSLHHAYIARSPSTLCAGILATVAPRARVIRWRDHQPWVIHGLTVRCPPSSTSFHG